MAGSVDVANAFEVSGWALCEDLRTADRVIIEVDGIEIARIGCSGFRKDLLEAGIGDGNSAYRFLFPGILGFEKPATLAVRSVSTGALLGPGPVAIKKPLQDAISRLALADGVPYAAAAWSAPSEGDRIEVRGRALAPRGAALGVRPISGSRVRIRNVEFSKTSEGAFFDDAIQLYNFLFVVETALASGRKIFAFELTDSNRASISSPVPPVAQFAIPSSREWLSPPPVANMIRTSGEKATEETFFVAGTSIAYALHSIIADFLPRNGPVTILDWGIGCGRVAVPLKRAMRPTADIIGLDVDDVNVSWCRESLPDIEVKLCNFFPPLGLSSNSIDVAYGISVMTHLTDAAQHVWLRELHRVLKPGGLCILSTHGEISLGVSRIRDPAIYRDLELFGISDRTPDRNLGEKLRLSGYYRATFQLRSQVEAAWSDDLKVIAYYHGGNGVFQDLVILRKE